MTVYHCLAIAIVAFVAGIWITLETRWARPSGQRRDPHTGRFKK